MSKCLTFLLLSCLIALGLSQFVPASADTSLRTDHPQYKIRRGEQPIRGVNLGAWLVLERWMSGSSPVWKDVPDKVANTGEYQTMKLLGHAEGDKRFEEHRSTWITEKDFAEIKKFGLNTVRVPVGYWIMEKDEEGGPFGNDWKMFAPGSLNYLDKAMQWGKQYNLAVFVDIHAAKGSENGMDHSSPTNPGISSWSDYPQNVNHTLTVADFIVKRYKDEPAFLGLGLLNEPFGNTSKAILEDFYKTAYKRIRQYSDCVLVHMPMLGEQDPGHWQEFCTEAEGYKNFWHEWHKYLLWGYEWATDDELIQQAESGLYYMIRAFKGTKLFNGEWSLGTSPRAPFNDEAKFKKFSAAYVRALEGAPAGWTYWSWRTSSDEGEKRDPWSMRQMLRRGYIKW